MDGVQLYRWMAISREFGAAIATVNGHWFTAEGEEAALVGSFCDLRADDIVAPHYRDPFVVYLMRGAEPWRLAAQTLGKSSGYNKGRSVPFTGPIEHAIVPWVAGDLGTSIGVATGAALAIQQEGSSRVCVCSFGDGTANRGDFHESINLAAIWRLPIVYICQNNGWAISQRAHTYLRAPVADRAAGYGMPGAAVDGLDVEAVRGAVADGVTRARAGEGPTLIETRTRRVGGHNAADKAAYRTAEEGRGEDPLDIYAARLIQRGAATADTLQAIRNAAAREAAAAVERARNAPAPGPGELGLDEVYA
jgi:acetoin:2,6-dichlorophenolindophenol oxidoreductase subunit alpha